MNDPNPSRRLLAVLLGGSVVVAAALWCFAATSRRGATRELSATTVNRASVSESHADPGDVVEAEWRRLAGAGRSANTTAMVRLIQELARVDAARALALAELAPDPELRRALMLAAVEAWARVDAVKSLEWSDAQRDADRALALGAAFAGAVKDPEAAVQLARDFCQRRPERAGDYGEHLIAALAGAKAYAVAARFAASASGEFQPAWVDEAYRDWAEADAVAALTAASTIEDSALRGLALRGLMTGWGKTEPSELADAALLLPQDSLREEALNEALSRWCTSDPQAAANWLRRQQAGPGFDAGAAALASDPRIGTAQPEVAVAWAANIAEPTARANALRGAAMEWARRDPMALRRFIDETPTLSDVDRTALREGLNPPPDA